MRDTGKFNYVTRPLTAGSEVYGPCDVCGKHVVKTYQQTRRRVFRAETTDRPALAMIYPNGQIEKHDGQIYGHIGCLLKQPAEDKQKACEALVA